MWMSTALILILGYCMENSHSLHLRCTVHLSRVLWNATGEYLVQFMCKFDEVRTKNHALNIRKLCDFEYFWLYL